MLKRQNQDHRWRGEQAASSEAEELKLDLSKAIDRSISNISEKVSALIKNSKALSDNNAR